MSEALTGRKCRVLGPASGSRDMGKEEWERGGRQGAGSRDCSYSLKGCSKGGTFQPGSLLWIWQGWGESLGNGLWDGDQDWGAGRG